MSNKYQSLIPLFETYDRASNEATDCVIASLEARRSGKTAIANYLTKKVYPKLAKRSYEFFCKYSDALDQL